jgi:hypothetical protein
MELLSRQGTFVSAACKACFLSMTIPEHVWETAKADRDASWMPDVEPPDTPLKS